MSVTNPDPVEVVRTFDRTRLFPCKWCGERSVDIEKKYDTDLFRQVYRFLHRCPPHVYNGSYSYYINDCAQEWNTYNAPKRKRADGFLNANPCQFCGENDLWLDEVITLGDSYYFGKHESCDCVPVTEFATRGYNTPEEVLAAWNLANPLPVSPDPASRPPLTPEELPALPFAPRRGKRLLETTKQMLDLDMVEIEVGLKEMRSYKDGKLITQREETVSLRARVKEGQTADQVYQALRLQAGQYIENAHQAHEDERKKQQTEDEATQRLLQSFISSPSSPSYASPNRGGNDDRPF